MENIRHHPNYDLALKSKLALTDRGVDLNNREENFQSSLVEKIPIIKILYRASARAYTTFANKLRFDIFNHLVDKSEKLGHKPYEDLKLKLLLLHL